MDEDPLDEVVDNTFAALAIALLVISFVAFIGGATTSMVIFWIRSII